MNKEQLLSILWKSPNRTAEAHTYVYRSRVFVIIDNSDHVYAFTKTKRGAEGQCRRNKCSYYDDYMQEMVSVSYQYIELSEKELPDINNKKLWYNYLKNLMGYDYMYKTAVSLAEKYANESIVDYVKKSIDDLKNNKGLVTPDTSETQTEIKQSETAQNSIEQAEIVTNEKSQAAAENDHKEQTDHVSMSLNTEMNGIELSFAAKPTEQIREQLKTHGFRWSRAKKIWYAKQSTERIQFAESLTKKCVYGDNEKSPDNNKLSQNESEGTSYPEINIDDLDSYNLSENLIKQENDSHWIFRSNETDWNKELKDTFSQVQDEVISILQRTEDEAIQYHLKKSLQSFKKNYFKTFEKWLSHRANNPSWAVTGRAGRSRRKDSQAFDREGKLLNELKQIQNKIEKAIDRANYKIEHAERLSLLNAVNDTQVTIDFIATKKQIEDYPRPVRIYIHGQYWIAKTWGAWRIYYNGNEINPNMPAGTLAHAKKFVQYYINQERQKEKAI